MQELNISHNNVGVKGIKLLCKTLSEEDSRVRILDVTNCGISEGGASAIGEMLEYCTALRVSSEHFVRSA